MSGNKEGHRWLTIYLQDHYAGAVAGTALFHRVAGSHGDPKVRRVVADLATEIDSDRQQLDEMMAALTVPHNRPKEYLAWGGRGWAGSCPTEPCSDGRR